MQDPGGEGLVAEVFAHDTKGSPPSATSKKQSQDAKASNEGAELYIGKIRLKLQTPTTGTLLFTDANDVRSGLIGIFGDGSEH